jgi:hypothetical protein
VSPSLEPALAGQPAYEEKFPVQSEVAAEVRRWARANMQPDPHGAGEFGDSYEISSLYLDTPELDIFHGDKASGGSKYRVRRYGAMQSVFLERKLKRGGIVRKWRTAVPSADLANLEHESSSADWDGQWYHERILRRGFRPVCQIHYDRMARVGFAPSGTIRLTMDRRIAALPQERMQFHTQALRPLEQAPIVLELKYRTEMPLVFKQLIREFKLEPRAVSKYKLAVESLALNTGASPELICRAS